MNAFQRLLRADTSRPTRFHDAKARLHISPDILRALWTTAARHTLGIYPRLPWVTYPVIARLGQLVACRRVLEFGAGSSTEWFSRHAAEVVSLENNAEWYSRASDALSSRSNVSLQFVRSAAGFVAALDPYPAFDVYLIDCQAAHSDKISTEDLRISCLRAAAKHGRADSIFVIDNTDANRALDAEVTKLFGHRNIERIAGWVPGIFHPNETTIVT